MHRYGTLVVQSIETKKKSERRRQKRKCRQAAEKLHTIVIKQFTFILLIHLFIIQDHTQTFRLWCQRFSSVTIKQPQRFRRQMNPTCLHHRKHHNAARMQCNVTRMSPIFSQLTKIAPFYILHTYNIHDWPCKASVENQDNDSETTP